MPVKYDTSAAVRLMTEKIEAELAQRRLLEPHGNLARAWSQFGAIADAELARKTETVKIREPSVRGWLRAGGVVPDFAQSERWPALKRLIAEQAVEVDAAMTRALVAGEAWVGVDMAATRLDVPEDPLAYFNPPEPPKSTVRKLPGADVVAGEWPRVQIGLKHVG